MAGVGAATSRSTAPCRGGEQLDDIGGPGGLHNVEWMREVYGGSAEAAQLSMKYLRDQHAAHQFAILASHSMCILQEPINILRA
jgi:hypothetical protein